MSVQSVYLFVISYSGTHSKVLIVFWVFKLKNDAVAISEYIGKSLHDFSIRHSVSRSIRLRRQVPSFVPLRHIVSYYSIGIAKRFVWPISPDRARLEGKSQTHRQPSPCFNWYSKICAIEEIPITKIY